jgi:hypothetical protein
MAELIGNSTVACSFGSGLIGQIRNCGVASGNSKVALCRNQSQFAGKRNLKVTYRLLGDLIT